MNDTYSEWRLTPDDPSGKREAAHDLARQLRRIIDRLAVVDAPEDDLRQAADVARGFAERLEALGRRSWFEGFGEAANAGSPHAFMDRSPLLGLANPLAPPLSLEMVGEGEERHVRGHGVFGAAYEGPPGCVHGGFVAAAFDEVLGFAQSIGGSHGMTGTLTVRYRSPTPLHTELQFRASLDRVEGRKIFCSGTCHADGTLTAEAEAIFVSVDFSKLAGDRLPPPGHR